MFCLRTGWTPEQVKSLTLPDYRAIEKELVDMDRRQQGKGGGH